MVDFALDDNYARDKGLSEICRAIWSGEPDGGGLISDLWVEGAFPSEASERSLDSLVAAGRFSAELRDVLHASNAMPSNRKLYTHQREAIELTQSGADGDRPSIVVSAGTGSGKTEAFLLPILDDLYRRPREDGEKGVEAIILYPMNALVNDQVDRLYSWLKDQSKVTMFHFTSETPENKRRADLQGIPIWGPSRMRTRQQARGQTPNIVITNYSMLEYMLCRPQDAVFFGPALRAIVLDEAHLYTGTLAAEITLLLRRLLLRCGLESKDVMQMATSATLGGGADSLLEFASQIFSKPPGKIHVVEGKIARAKLDAERPPASAPTAADIAARRWLTSPTLIQSRDGETSLATIDDAEAARLKDDLAALVSRERVAALPADERRPAVMLRETLAAAPLIHRLEDTLFEKRHTQLEELGETLFGDRSEDSKRAASALLKLGAAARSSAADYPLTPHRIHVLTRPADGMTVCLNDNCTGDDARKLAGLGIVSAGHRNICDACGCATLALHRCDNCGEHMLAGDYRDGKLTATAYNNQKTRRYVQSESANARGVEYIDIDRKTGEEQGSGASGAIRVKRVSECPNCGATARDSIRPFSSGSGLPLSLTAETLLSEMPEFPSEHPSANAWLPARGRRLLAFSDSRRESARLGPLLTNQHEQQVVRAAIVEALENMPVANSALLKFYEDEIERIEVLLANPNLPDPVRQLQENNLRRTKNDLKLLIAGGSIDMLTQLLSPVGRLDQILHRETSERHKASSWKQLKWEDNHKKIKEQTKRMLGRETARLIATPGRTLETLGLVEVTYPGLGELEAPSQFIGVLPTEYMRENVRGAWTDILAFLCDNLRSAGVITLGEEEEDEAHFSDAGTPMGVWAASQSTGYGVVRFVGAMKTQRRRQFVANVLKRCGVPDDQADDRAVELLRAAFDQLLDADNGKLEWLERDDREVFGGGAAPAFRIVFDKLGLRRPPQLYRCEQTGRVVPRSVLGCAPYPGADGTLAAVSHDDLDADARLGRRRKEYQDSSIFEMGLWAEEHSAQLAPQENRRIQDLFKAGVRNMLSATTTLELGIDIGGLNGALMGNIPPGKANYLQRAGRAGRRADGSSLVTVFARPRPFDREVFLRMGDYLDLPLRKPIALLDRERLARRHVHSFLLNEFLTREEPARVAGAMDAFGRMGEFCGVASSGNWVRGGNKPSARTPTTNPSLSEGFVAFLENLKADEHSVYRAQVRSLIDNTPLSVSNEGWEKTVGAAIESFTEAVGEWRKDYDALMNDWKDIPDSDTGRMAQANALHWQMLTLRELTVIEALADRQFLPRYGFPINVLKLGVIEYDENTGRRRVEDRFRLERGGLLALREYVPGSQVVVGGKLVVSRGIQKHWTGEDINTSIGLRGLYNVCEYGHPYYWVTQESEQNCDVCGARGDRFPMQMMFPRNGFSTAAWDPPKWGADIASVGETDTIPAQISVDRGAQRQDDFADVCKLSAFYKEAGELVVYNQAKCGKGFAICLRCGYADSERERDSGAMKLPSEFENHASLFSEYSNSRCWRNGTAAVLRNQVLASQEITDVLLVDFSECLGDGRNDEALVTTLAFALKRAAAETLQLDGREIGALTTPAGELGVGLGALLFDNVPGGAGHVRELMEMGRDWLQRARDILYVDEAHAKRCMTACLDCLLSFETQTASGKGLLKRPRALEALDRLLAGECMPRSNGADAPQDHS